MRRRWLWILVILAVLTAGGALYFKRALFFVFEKAHPLLFKSDLITTMHPQYGMDLRPNLVNARLVVPARPTSPRQLHDPIQRTRIKRLVQFLVSTNSHHFRGPEFSTTPPAGGFRMACVGDSITFGWGVPESESYPRLLEKLLTDALPGRKVEVINGGTPGFPINGVPDALRYKIAPYKPSVVYVMKWGDLAGPDPLGAYRKKLLEIDTIARELGMKLILGVPPSSTFDLKPESKAFTEALEAFGREHGVPTLVFTPLFRKEAEGRGVKLVQTDKEQQLVRYNWGRASVLVRAPVQRDRVSVAPEIYEYLDTHDDTEALFFDDGHPDAEGNALIAREILKVLKAQGWLDTPTATP